MNNTFELTSDPHVQDPMTTKKKMIDILIAITPATLFGFWNFGENGIVNVALCIATCILAEHLCLQCNHRDGGIDDLSAAVTGLLLGICLPANAPFWLPVVGGIFAIVFVKQAFRGIAQCIFHPVVTTLCFLLIAFPKIMADVLCNGPFAFMDATTSATALATIKTGGSVDVMQVFLGNVPGTIGETSAILLLLGGLYLIAKKVISYRVPATFLFTVACFFSFFGGRLNDWAFVGDHLFGGGLMLAAFFLAADPSTSPKTAKGQIIYGVVLGLLTGVFRLLGDTAEGVAFAILFTNILTPVIDICLTQKKQGENEL